MQTLTDWVRWPGKAPVLRTVLYYLNMERLLRGCPILIVINPLISWLLLFFQICAFGTTPLPLSSFANPSPSFPASLKRTQFAFLREVWRHVTMVQNFWISTIFLDRDGHLDRRKMKQTHGLPFCSWAQSCKGKVIHLILAAIIAGARFAEIQKIFYRSNVT